MILLSASVVTLGCRLNQADSALICDRLRKCGFEIVPEDGEESPSVIIVNSCAVTETAAKKTRQVLKQLRHNHPYSYLIFTGCSANLQKEENSDNLEYDVLLPSERKKELEAVLSRQFNIDAKKLKAAQQAAADSEKAAADADAAAGENIFREKAFTYTPFKHRANLKIQDGCNNFCTYCIVPYTRGRERSRSLDEVIADFRNLVSEGFKEIVLTGVNTCQYEYNGIRITGLIQKLFAEAEGDYRLRIGSLEPGPMLAELIDLMAETPRICDFLHIPLQSGSDPILKAMGRKYTAAEYRAIAELAKKKLPHIHLGCDYITGFPGETKELFRESCDFIRNIGFANVHVFPYSPRKGTPAAEMKGRPAPAEMAERIEILKQIKADCAAEFAKSLIGSETTIIPERMCAQGIYEGHSSNYMKVRVASKEKDITGQLVKVKLTSISANNPELIGGKIIG